MVKAIVITILLVSVISASAYFHDRSSDSDEKTTIVENDISAINSSEKSEINLPLGQSTPANKDTRVENVVSKNEIKTPKLDYFTKETFVSEQRLNDTFVNDQQAVVRETLDAVFQSNNFDLLLDSVNEIEKSHSSIERQRKLNETLYKLLANSYFDEKVACAGKVCLVEFKYSAEPTEDELSEIRSFDNNYSFISFGKQEEGNYNRFKALYIETDDPSKLKLDR